MNEREPGDGAFAEALDAAHLARQTLGDAALARELLALFLAQTDEFGARRAAAGSDKARRDLAHTLQGAARAIGAFPLADAARAYEATLLAGEPPEAALTALDRRLAEARAAIAAHLDRTK